MSLPVCPNVAFFRWRNQRSPFPMSSPGSFWLLVCGTVVNLVTILPTRSQNILDSRLVLFRTFPNGSQWRRSRFRLLLFQITITGLITDDSFSANRNIDLTMYRFSRIQTSWFLTLSTRQGCSFEKIKQKFLKNSWILSKMFNKARARGDKVEKPQETKHE